MRTTFVTTTVTAALILLTALSHPAKARSKGRKRGFGAIVVVSEGRSWKMAASVLEQVQKRPEPMTTRGILVEQANPEEDPAFLRLLLRNIRRARKDIFRLRLKPAIRRLRRIIAKISSLLQRNGTAPGLLRRYMQANNYLGAAYQLDGNPTAAAACFRIVLSINPRRRLKAKYYTAEVIATFNKLKRTFRKNGTLRVKTDKPIFVFVDGHLKGVAPVVITGLYPGDHVVELRRLGYLRITRLVTVDPQTGGSLQARVVKDLKHKNLRKLMAAVERGLRKKERPVEVVAKLATALRVRQLMLVRASLDDGEASLFDADSRRFLKRVRRICALPGTPPATNIATALTRATPVLDLQGGAAASGGTCEDSDDCTEGTCVSGRCVSETPIYKKWWFWTIIGVAVGAVAAGGAILGTIKPRPTIQITIGASGR